MMVNHNERLGIWSSDNIYCLSADRNTCKLDCIQRVGNTLHMQQKLHT